MIPGYTVEDPYCKILETIGDFFSLDNVGWMGVGYLCAIAFVIVMKLTLGKPKKGDD